MADDLADLVLTEHSIVNTALIARRATESAHEKLSEYLFSRWHFNVSAASNAGIDDAQRLKFIERAAEIKIVMRELLTDIQAVTRK